MHPLTGTFLHDQKPPSAWGCKVLERSKVNRWLDGTHGPEAAAARSLADAIRRESGLPVELVDERLTTAAAERALIAGGVKREQRRQGIDRVAATMLLQSHLDYRRRQKPG